MVDFEDDFFAAMVQDDTSGGALKKSSSRVSINSGFDDYFGNDAEAAAPQQRRSRRRASIANPASAAASLTKSSSRESPSESSGRIRRPGTGATSSRSLDGNLEPMSGGRNKNSGGERSVASSGSSERPRRVGRRASLAAGPTRSAPHSSREPKIEESVNYGYGDEASSPEEVDMGYGDPDPPPEEGPVRARRQRRCSIADVVSSAAAPSASNSLENGYGEAHSDSGDAPSLALARGMSQRVGALSSGNNTITNMAIPMAAPDEPKRTNRRGSIAMLSSIGRSKPKVEHAAPEAAAKKPGADRDRHRQGTLLDRVGASSGDARNAGRSGAASSYSDRILSK